MIRAIRPEDSTAVAELLALAGFPDSAEAVAHRIVRLDKHREFGLVADHEGAVEGVLAAHAYHVLHRAARVGRITLLIVHPDVHGTGRGRSLLEAAEARLRLMHCELVEVISNHRYRAAHGFYEHLGYLRTSSKFRKDL